jgi:hypothetical protein
MIQFITWRCASNDGTNYMKNIASGFLVPRILLKAAQSDHSMPKLGNSNQRSMHGEGNTACDRA